MHILSILVTLHYSGLSFAHEKLLAILSSKGMKSFIDILFKGKGSQKRRSTIREGCSWDKGPYCKD
jgi:hypothetical protein